MPVCANGNCKRMADGQKPSPSYCTECTIGHQVTIAKRRSKALQAYSDFKKSTKNRNKTRVAKGKPEVEVCTQEEFLSVCFTSAYTRKPCAAEGCTRESYACDRIDTSVLTYAGNCQPLCTQCNSSKGG
jgi:hypothetical protein